MSVRGTVTYECDQKGCHAELVFDVDGSDIEQRKKGLGVQYYADGWHEDDNGELFCPQCSGADDDRDEAYERAAARARNNDFADTGGKDWT